MTTTSKSFLVDRLTDVVQQAAATRYYVVGAELGGDDAGDRGNLHRVAEHVLTIRGTELQHAEQTQ